MSRESVRSYKFGPAFIAGRVEEIELQEKGARVRLSHLYVSRMKPGDVPAQIRVKLTAKSDIPKIGERIETIAMLHPPPAPAAPGAYDFRRDLYYRQIGAVGYSVRRYEAKVGAGAVRAPWIERLRQTASERIAAALPDPAQKAEQAISVALLTGQRGPISDEVNQQMRDSGLAHLLAISGMNITLAAGMIYFMVRFLLAAVPYLALRLPIKKIAAACGLLGAVAYTEFVGAPISAERAMITTVMMMLAIMIDRSPLTLRLAAVAASLLLLLEPEALMGASFQMSFGAIVALLVLYEYWRGHRPDNKERSWIRRALIYLAGIAIMSLVASAATALFAIYHFQQNAFYGIGANLIAVPLNDLWIMPWAVMAYALMGGVGADADGLGHQRDAVDRAHFLRPAGRHR